MPGHWSDFQEPIYQLKEADLPEVNLEDADRDFLINTGFPRSAAPFLGFDAIREGALLSVQQQFGVQKVHTKWMMLGSDSAGNPISLDSSNGEVWVLDHEDNFHTQIFMNSTLRGLADCLVGYRRLVDETMSQNGDEAFLRGHIPIDSNCLLSHYCFRHRPKGTRSWSVLEPEHPGVGVSGR